MRDNQPPLEYLVTSSQTSLEAFELTRLNCSANLRKELREILDEWLQSEVDARLARWILECRRAQSDGPTSLAAPPHEPARVGQLAMSFLPQARSGSRNEGMANRLSGLTEKAPEDRRSLCSRPQPGDCHQPPSAPVNSPSPVNSPINSTDASAILRIFEQFLAHPVESTDAQADNSPSGLFGAAFASEDQPSGRCGVPHQDRVGPARRSPIKTPAAHRPRLRTAPSIQSVCRLAAQHNR